MRNLDFYSCKGFRMAEDGHIEFICIYPNDPNACEDCLANFAQTGFAGSKRQEQKPKKRK